MVNLAAVDQEPPLSATWHSDLSTSFGSVPTVLSFIPSTSSPAMEALNYGKPVPSDCPTDLNLTGTPVKVAGMGFVLLRAGGSFNDANAAGAGPP